ncbi:Beta-galactosidase-1-like protein 2 [Oopsacas minuta]|uniref:Beta-galactosidase-1-like protein 2 n=1 Tax=Oopsacas minuta TaxID=111878 RepID=A0AAV7JZF4_9METZ|nr:Beta-galactosidase-1-like protein 2 [Oopsacas minuta]
MLAELQANRGGPIIAFQIENEYGSYGEDIKYMKYIYNSFRRRGIGELLITSDGIWKLPSVLRPDVLQTINGDIFGDESLAKFIANHNPEYPLMVTEFWVGWFTGWGEKERATRDAELMTNMLAKLLEKGFSVNIYMFHGGTNFGFTNGALHFENYTTHITSYDYDAPLTENGDVTEKYKLFRGVLSGYTFGRQLPPIPQDIPTESYGEASMHLYLPLLDTVVYLPYPAKANKLLSMEQLPMNLNGGQRFGYLLYRTRVKKESTQISIENCFQNQTGLIMVNNQHLHNLRNYNKLTLSLPYTDAEEYVIDILYEGLGRVNYGPKLDYQRQKLIGPVSIDDDSNLAWKIYAIEFQPSFLSTAEAGGIWKRMPTKERIPMLVKGTIEIKGNPKDTFADMSNWGKGILFINQINLGRYWNIGPQQTLYVPSNVLRMGINKIMIFEAEMPSRSAGLPVINFVDKPIL